MGDTASATHFLMLLVNRTSQEEGLPPLVQSKQRRGQARLPDLFYSDLFYFLELTDAGDVGSGSDAHVQGG